MTQKTVHHNGAGTYGAGWAVAHPTVTLGGQAMYSSSSSSGGILL